MQHNTDTVICSTFQPQFSHFFLSFMHGRYNFMNLVHDLSTLDPELYKNLMFLKVCACFAWQVCDGVSECKIAERTIVLMCFMQ